jgi:hypothetical protein
VKSLDRKRMEGAQKTLSWAIESLKLSIRCMVINYKDNKYKAQFFTWGNRLVRGVGFSIPEEWIRDTNPMKNDIRDELRSLLRELEEEARKREEVKTD